MPPPTARSHRNEMGDKTNLSPSKRLILSFPFRFDRRVVSPFFRNLHLLLIVTTTATTHSSIVIDSSSSKLLQQHIAQSHREGARKNGIIISARTTPLCPKARPCQPHSPPTNWSPRNACLRKSLYNAYRATWYHCCVPTLTS